MAWILGAVMTGRREPWDTDAYWYAVYPASLLGGLVLAESRLMSPTVLGRG